MWTALELLTMWWSHGPQDQTVELLDEGRYTVSVRDQFGCRGAGTIELFHNVCLIGLYIPNGFTPNDDGTNDFFFAVENNVTLQELSVFNRWGQKIVTLNSASESWDGKTNGQPAPEGVYIWRARALDDKGVEFTRQGTITLIR
jgi:gliding motility-associated-like protein